MLGVIADYTVGLIIVAVHLLQIALRRERPLNLSTDRN